MLLKNPNKNNKVSYSFRISPELLEKIKQYAKATNQTVPEILNNMIENKIKNLQLTNDYLNIPLSFNGVFQLPNLIDLYNDGNYKEFSLFSNDYNNNFRLYKIKQVPNNLDIWTDTEGYKSNKRGVTHEGLSFLLATDLITSPEYLENPDLLLCCLVPIYFKVVFNSFRNSTVEIRNISFKNAFKKISQTENINLLNDFINFIADIEAIICRYCIILKNAQKNQDKYIVAGITFDNKTNLSYYLLDRLINELEEYSQKININILNYYNEISNDENKTVKANLTLWEEIENTKKEIDKKNKVITELEAELKELKRNQKAITQILFDENLIKEYKLK